MTKFMNAIELGYINHKLLLAKLTSGFNESAHRESTDISNTCGIPQGSIL